MSVAAGEGSQEKPGAASAEPQQALPEAGGGSKANEAGDEGGGAPAAEQRSARDGKFLGVPQPGKYHDVSKSLGVAAWSNPENQTKSIPGLQTVYWHTRVTRKGEPELFLSPGVKIMLASMETATYMATVTMRGLPTRLLVCTEYRTDVRLVDVAVCVGVVKPNG